MEEPINVTIELPALMMMLRPLNNLVRTLIRQVPALAGDDEMVNNIELAFDEAFTNISRHAYPHNHKGTVTVRIRIDTESLEFQFEDHGACYDPSKIRDPDLDRPCESGLGVWLMRQVMDEFIYYRREDGKNVLKLVKRLQLQSR